MNSPQGPASPSPSTPSSPSPPPEELLPPVQGSHSKQHSKVPSSPSIKRRAPPSGPAASGNNPKARRRGTDDNQGGGGGERGHRGSVHEGGRVQREEMVDAEVAQAVRSSTCSLSLLVHISVLITRVRFSCWRSFYREPDSQESLIFY
jgi:hypothetical protein